MISLEARRTKCQLTMIFKSINSPRVLSVNIPHTIVHWNTLPFYIPVLPTVAQFSLALSRCSHLFTLLKHCTIHSVIKGCTVCYDATLITAYRINVVFVNAQFIKIISHYKKIGYNINVLQQTACLVVNPITVGNFAFLFNCTPVGRTSDSMMVPT